MKKCHKITKKFSKKKRKNISKKFTSNWATSRCLYNVFNVIILLNILTVQLSGRSGGIGSPLSNTYDSLQQVIHDTKIHVHQDFETLISSCSSNAGTNWRVKDGYSNFRLYSSLNYISWASKNRWLSDKNRNKNMKIMNGNIGIKQGDQSNTLEHGVNLLGEKN